MLHYYPRHVSSINMPIFGRKNCIHTASGIIALCKRLHSTPVESVTYILLMNKELCIKVGKWSNSILWCMVKKTSSYISCIVPLFISFLLHLFFTNFNWGLIHGVWNNMLYHNKNHPHFIAFGGGFAVGVVFVGGGGGGGDGVVAVVAVAAVAAAVKKVDYIGQKVKINVRKCGWFLWYIICDFVTVVTGFINWNMILMYHVSLPCIHLCALHNLFKSFSNINIPGIHRATWKSLDTQLFNVLLLVHSDSCATCTYFQDSSLIHFFV